MGAASAAALLPSKTAETASVVQCDVNNEFCIVIYPDSDGENVIAVACKCCVAGKLANRGYIGTERAMCELVLNQ
ncbi:hypothetical protein MPQ_1952 [Methylovorus sp. MP688]|nr:hypothetical protein MPQ_1952 [Methylovorus sp. MP688]